MQPPPTYRPEIDGLRAVAVAAVIFFHAGTPGFSNGHLGVDIFFVISGYLITRIIWSDLASGRFSLAHFYERRARRILPALLATCGLSLVAAWFVMAPSVLVEFAVHLAAALLFAANAVYWMQADYFATSAQLLPLLHTWSLAVEEQFYFVYPAILLIIVRLPAAGRIAALAGLTLLSFACAIIVSARSPDAAFYLLPNRLWELTAGALIATNELRRAAAGCVPLSHSRPAPFLAAAGVVACILAATDLWTPLSHPGWATLIPVCGAGLFLAFARSASGSGRILSLGPLVGLGLISYSLYLLHQPVLAFGRIWLARPLTPRETVAAIAIAGMAACLSWFFVEQPFRKPARIRARPFIATAAALTTALIVGAGLTVARDGFPGRMDAAVASVLRTLEPGNPARRAGIGLLTCHWNRQAGTVQHFLDRWDCTGTHRPRIIVYGDSTAGEKAWALRMAGFDVGNLSGSGCLLKPTPADARYAACDVMLARALQKIRDYRIDGVVLAHGWLGAVPASEQAAIVSYWKQAEVPVILFSGGPVFPNLRDRITRSILRGRPLDTIGIDEEAYEAHMKSLTVFRDAGWSIIDTRQLLCGSLPCIAFEGTTPLVSDHIHLLEHGARRIAAAVPHDPTWLSWVEAVRREATARESPSAAAR